MPGRATRWRRVGVLLWAATTAACSKPDVTSTAPQSPGSPAAAELVGSERGHPWFQHRGADPTDQDTRVADARTASSGVLQFLAFGDSGLGDDNQKAVARHMRTVCQQRGCDFAIHTGDILYPRGIQTADRKSTR